MTDTKTSPSSAMKRALIVAGSLVAALAVIYFSFFYPPVSTSDTEGTIGAVKKYRAEQITEKDVVLEGMASMNIEAVNQAMEQTGAKLAESAREVGKAAEGLLASARTPEAKSYFEGLTALANKAEALKAGVESRTSGFAQAAAIAEAVRDNASKIESMTAESRSDQAKKAQDAVKDMEKWANGLRGLSLRSELIGLAAEARTLMVKAEGLRQEGKTTEWNKLAEGAAALARQADGLKPYYEGKAEMANFAESATAFARSIEGRVGVDGKLPSEARDAAFEASKSMAEKAATLAAHQAEGRLAPGE